MTLPLNLTITPSAGSAATALAVGFLGHCLREAAAGLPYDVERIALLLEDDDVYFAAADRLVGDATRRGWRAVRAELSELPAYRAAVLEHGCSGLLRNGFEVIFFGEFALGPAEG
ncbi:MAG TPA: hypothetical protein VMZ11_01750 [Mycobacteriales bacterium]|nr:hypothetical protein [Mycobacteriales bacterium]